MSTLQGYDLDYDCYSDASNGDKDGPKDKPAVSYHPTPLCRLLRYTCDSRFELYVVISIYTTCLNFSECILLWISWQIYLVLEVRETTTSNFMFIFGDTKCQNTEKFILICTDESIIIQWRKIKRA